MGGWIHNTATGDDALVAAYNVASGEQLWSRTYDGHLHGTDHVWALAVDGDGSSVFVSNGSYPAPGRLRSLAADDGAIEWGTPVTVGDTALELAPGPAGDLFAMSEGGDEGRDYIATVYDGGSGAPGWFGTWPSSSGDATGIVALPNGSAVVVTGGATDDVTTVAFSAV
jgi:hypothetical protein